LLDSSVETQSKAPLLEAMSLLCERDDRVLFDKLSFSIAPGDIAQVEGPNGSGKTTLIRILCGLSTDFEGKLFWRGQPMASSRERFCQEHLYFGHLTGIKAPLTAVENLRWMALCRGSSLQGPMLDDAIDQALFKVGLNGFEDAPVYTLSAGQKRRVALARLFLEAVPLWVLDEPFTAIDKKGVAELEKIIEQHAKQGGAVILTTHHELSIDPVHHKNIRLVSIGEGE